MARTPAFKYKSTSRGWKVEIPSRYSTSGTRERVYFKTRDIRERANHTPPLFQTVADTMAPFDQEKQRRLDETIDRLRARYGRKVVFFGSVQDSRLPGHGVLRATYSLHRVESLNMPRAFGGSELRI